MAPDLNTVPLSPRNLVASSNIPSTSSSRSSSRRTSHAMARPASREGAITTQDSGGVPMRHPRPMTAAELHLQMEKEQEAVVNQLTRELAALRSQSVSVVSNASSSSSAATSVFDPTETIQLSTSAYPLTGPTHPTPSRRHRSSSSLSTRSVTTAQAFLPAGSSSQASVDRARDAAGVRSRQNSAVVLPLRSGAPSPNPSASQQQSILGGIGDTGGVHLPAQRQPSSAAASLARSPSVSTQRYEEAAQAKQALDNALRDNERLVQRVKELEKRLRGERGSGERKEQDSATMEPEAARGREAERSMVDGGG